MTKERSHVDDLRGAGRLAVEATQGITALVEAMHATIASGPAILGQPLAGPARVVTELVYGTVRGVAGLVGAGIDLALSQLEPLLGSSVPGAERETVLSALNGVLGDYLVETSNSLAIEMSLRPVGEPRPKLLVLLHGSSLDDRSWAISDHDYGKLGSELGYTPVYLRYNSGLHISTNGRAFSDQLERLVATWPVPIEEIALLGFSMGGLVARSACQIGAQSTWRSHVRRLITIGSPHHGAPLERGGNWVGVLLGLSRYSAPLARLAQIRSAGITDLRYGNVLDEHWQGRDRFEHRDDDRTPLPLPGDVACYAIAGTLSPEPGGELAGDGLVPVDSALGTHATTALTLAFPEDHRSIVYGTGHLQLLASPVVHEALRRWLS